MLKRTIADGMTDLREVNLKKLTFPARNTARLRRY